MKKQTEDDEDIDQHRTNNRKIFYFSTELMVPRPSIGK